MIESAACGALASLADGRGSSAHRPHARRRPARRRPTTTTGAARDDRPSRRSSTATARSTAVTEHVPAHEGRRDRRARARCSRARPPATRPRSPSGVKLAASRSSAAPRRRRFSAGARRPVAQRPGADREHARRSSRPSRTSVDRRRRPGGARATARRRPRRPVDARADYVDLTPDALIFVRHRRATRRSRARSRSRAPPTPSRRRSSSRSARGGKLVADEDDHRHRRAGTPRHVVDERSRSPHGDVTLVLYEPSAEDGSHLHTTEVLAARPVALSTRRRGLQCRRRAIPGSSIGRAFGC